MKRAAIVFLVIAIHSVSLFAQNDKLYLVKNGYLKGRILTGDQHKVSFVIGNQDTVKLSWAVINGVKLYPDHDLTTFLSEKIDSLNNRYNNTFSFYTDFGGHFDNSIDENRVGSSMSAIGIYRWRQYIQIGLGVSLYKYSAFNAFPVFIQYQGDFSRSNEGLYYYGAIGKAIAWRKSSCDCNFEDVEGGQFIKAGIGYKFVIGGLRLNTSFGWLQQKMRADFDSDIWFFAPSEMNRTIIKQTLNGVEIRFGITL